MSLENLGLTYLDLFLIHWPMAYKVRVVFIYYHAFNSSWRSESFQNSFKIYVFLIHDWICLFFQLSHFTGRENGKWIERTMKEIFFWQWMLNPEIWKSICLYSRKNHFVHKIPLSNRKERSCLPKMIKTKSFPVMFPTQKHGEQWKN